ncbi:MAG: transposase [Candidatus Latescibacteria bacterium]|nr:transposase [Candidatus Latescibacterota bacterium]
MDKKLLDLYSDYLLSSFGATTATGLSSLLDGQISHDQVTRFLSQAEYTSKELWHQVKTVVRTIEREDGVLIFDDTIQEKPHTDENELICWHFDHSKNCSVKGLNLLNCIYQAGDVSVPVAYEFVRKPIRFCDLQTRRVKRKSAVTKNQLLRQMLRTCQQNRADSWFAAKENLLCIRQDLKKHFIVALQSNRTVALSLQDKAHGRFVRIDTLDWSDPTPVTASIKGRPFPVLLHRRVFTNKDDSTGMLYLACSNLDQHEDALETIYQKRWKVEVFHKTLKSHAALAKSPTKRVRTQSNHVFMAIYAAFSLEWLRIKQRMNPFALRSKLYLKAIRHAFDELQKLKAA